MAELVEVVKLVGLVEGRVTEQFDCYEGTSSKSRLASDVGVRGTNLYARKPR